ncbi:hypothetical protein M0R45_002108 [Rubus argutus]|uniref:Uncharacterized protein n=1 Tax=Rubus argutus TaxID=59490 RepID=A0AAW1VKG2_RUBAR
MANWLEVKLDLPQAIRLKKAVRAIGQVAFTDGDYPDEWFTAIPNTAHLCFTSRFMVLACGLSHNYFPKILTFLHIPSSIMRRLDCDESCAVTFPLHILLKQLELNTEFSLSLYGDDFADDGIRYELEDDDGSIIHSSTLPVTEFEGQVDLSFLEYQFPMSIGLSSDLFCHVINELEIYGSTIRSTVSENEVVFRVVNHELRFPREPGWCEIHSDANEYPFVLKFDLQHKSAFLNAAVLSEMVWIHKTTESLTVLDCPIEHLGNLLFNFFMKDDEAIPN